MIHREALASKKLQPDVNKVLLNAISVINFIKSKSLNSRLFTILCNEMGSDHEKLLLHTEVRWLSRGKILSRLFELRDEARIFLLERNNKLSEHFLDEQWLAILGYLADIFEKLNCLNLSLQGKNTNILFLSDKINAFKKKILLWKNYIDDDKFEMFSCLSEFLSDNDVDINMIKEIITTHLISLQTNFNARFEDFPEESLGWIRNPFHFNINEIKLGNLKISEELIDLSSDENLRIRFQQNACDTFWISIKSEYPELSKQAISILLPFASTYLCETAFSTLTIIKNKYRSRLNVEADLRVAVSNIKPNIESIMSTMQAQVSH